MSTKAQVKANRKNSQKSTGPQTPEGKAAVAKNAIKHGLFASEAVVKGENEADFEAFHDEMLAELAPVGVVESVLAARVVSLSWRLQRVERMQNQVIEDMIERQVTNPGAKKRRETDCYKQGIFQDDPRFGVERLPLARVATSDWSSCAVLDRMLMYERRIENSLLRMMHELERRRLLRQLKQAEKATEEPAIPKRGTGFQPVENMAKPVLSAVEGMAMPLEKKGNLKKQSQFPAKAVVSAFAGKDYDSDSARKAERNKADLSTGLSRMGCLTANTGQSAGR